MVNPLHIKTMKKSILITLAATLGVGALVVLIGKHLYDDVWDTTTFDFD